MRKQNLPLVCEKSALSVNNEESLLPIISSTQLSSSDDLPSICDKSSVLENDEVCQLCDVAEKSGNAQHKSRLCLNVVCNLFCSIQDPNSSNQMHRIHKPGHWKCLNQGMFEYPYCEKSWVVQKTYKITLRQNMYTSHSVHLAMGT